MKKILVPAITTAILSISPAFAFETANCPDVSAIKEVGLNAIQLPPEGQTGWIASYHPAQNYGTRFVWSFVIGTHDDDPEVVDEATALVKATEALQTLSFKEDQSAGSYYICAYRTSSATVVAYAISPPIAGGVAD